MTLRKALAGASLVLVLCIPALSFCADGAGFQTDAQTPRPSKQNPKSFWRFARVQLLLTSADIGTSVAIFQKGGYEREMAFATGRHPEAVAFGAELYAATLAWEYTAYRFQPKHPRLSRIMRSVALADSAYSVGSNARTLATWDHRKP
jgi:hypothetical protein